MASQVPNAALQETNFPTAEDSVENERFSSVF